MSFFSHLTLSNRTVTIFLLKPCVDKILHNTFAHHMVLQNWAAIPPAVPHLEKKAKLDAY